MCTHLDKTGATYYFRRPVPKEILGYFLTDTGKARTEWKFSLRTKDREEAKRLLRPWQNKTDLMIDEARAALQAAASSPPVDPAALERQREEQAALAELAAESDARKAARGDLRTAWHRRKMTSTALLTPEQAAAVDLIKERDATIEELRRALAVVEASYDGIGVARAEPQGKPGLRLTVLFERYAATGVATPKTISKWRGRVSPIAGSRPAHCLASACSSVTAPP